MLDIGCKVALLPSGPYRVREKDFDNEIALIAGPMKEHLNPWRISHDWVKVVKRKFGAPDVINFHYTYSPFQTALAKLFLREGWAYVLTPRGGLTRCAQGIKPLKKKMGNLLFFKKFVTNAKALHVLCENEAADIDFFYPQVKTFIVPNGIDENLFILSSQLKKKKLQDFRKKEDIVFGFVGRISIYHKGIDLLLLSLKSLQDRGLGQNIKLLLIGPFYTPKDEQQVRNLIKSLRFPDNVMIAGPLNGNEKWRLLLSCDVFTHTSRFEGMPMAVLEAMAFGKPCLVTPGSNMQKIVSKCNGGWLCDSTIDSIIVTISKIYEERGLIYERGINAKKHIKKNYSWSKIALEWTTNVRKILGNRANG
jgi:glycosyltransferase involved in cell wall biosynthesis